MVSPQRSTGCLRSSVRVCVVLEHDAQGCQDQLTQLNVPGARDPLLERELDGVGLVALEDLFHPPGELRAVDLDIDLVVADRAETVQIGRADGRPNAVYRAGLGMDHRLAVAEDLDAGPQAIAE